VIDEHIVDLKSEPTVDEVMSSSSYSQPPVYAGGNPLVDRLRLENDAVLPSSSVASTRKYDALTCTHAHLTQ
jgi:hypothetical protein